MTTAPRAGPCVVVAFLLSVGCGRPSRTGSPAARPPAPRAWQESIKLRHLRFSSEKEKARWERAIASVWKTPLGEMFAEYLFSPTEDHADMPLWARMVTERIFRETQFLNVRLGAIQVMTDDLYVSERMTADVNDRVTILQGHIDQERIWLQQTANSFTLFNAAVSLLPALPFGSSYFRDHFVDVVRERLRQSLPPRFIKIQPAAAPYIPREHSYSLYQLLSYWSVTYLVVTSIEWLYREAIYTSSFAPKDEVLLLSLDDLVTSMDLTERKRKLPLWSPVRDIKVP